MKKGFLFLMMGLMVWGFSLKAQASTRVDSMSLDVRQINDIDLIWLYPNLITDYKNTVDFRLGNLSGGGTSEWGGVIVGMTGDLGVWGVYVNRPTVQYNDANNLVTHPVPMGTTYWSSLGSYFGGFPWGASNNSIDAFYANKIGDATLGGRISYAENWNSSYLLYGTIKTENWGFSLGLGLPNFLGFKQASIHADYDVQFTNTPLLSDFGFPGIPEFENDGIQTFRIGTLLDSDLAKDTNLRLFGDMKLDQYKYTELNTFYFLSSFGFPYPPILDYNQNSIDLGASVNQTVFDGKGMLTSGLIFDYYAAKENAITSGQSQQSWDAFWNVAAEAEVADWLTIRTGIEFPLYSRDFGVIDPTGFGPPGGNFYLSNTTPGTVAFSTGAGINFENFILDLKINESSLDASINNVNPGKGLFTAGNMLTVGEADLKYKF